jgi:hypothetical protein
MALPQENFEPAEFTVAWRGADLGFRDGRCTASLRIHASPTIGMSRIATCWFSAEEKNVKWEKGFAGPSFVE